MIAPTTADELAEAVRAMPRLLAVGARTKPRLFAVDVPKLSTAKLTGIVEYEPEEFTFTALAGTPMREIAAALAERGQYLPFDPMLCDAGATLGGTIAAGLSGPGRFRYGGLRDFILGVRFVDGMGRLLRMGGKVVKNAAGFDLPKFFVGSLGRFGVLAEATFKVFPRPAGTLTIAPPVTSIESAVALLTRVANSRWEAEALDVMPGTNIVMMRLSGPESSLHEIALDVIGGPGGVTLSAEDAEFVRKDFGEFQWVFPHESLVKVALTPAKVASVTHALLGLGVSRIHFSAGGNVAFVAVPASVPMESLGSELQRLGLLGLTLRGDAPLWIGERRRTAIEHRVKQALDPDNRFPSLDE
jgi:glycolate oxidase FAD binding subunit